VSKNRIDPRILKGFRDYLPPLAMMRETMIDTLKGVFSSFGFAPIDTPALEYSDILLGKGSAETDKQLYRFEDNGKRDVALRFDLTVPLARYIAMHHHELGRPFKRYHIAPVWRAEKPQRGRYREFFQCDFDVLGTDSVIADAEVLALINASLNALNVRHRIRLNNRMILNGLLEDLGAENKSVAVLRAIDKLEKLGRDTVVAELSQEAGLSTEAIDQVLEFIELSKDRSGTSTVLNKLSDMLPNSEKAQKGISDVETIFSVLNAYGLGDETATLDLSIARGLDYYTGTVFETELVDLPKIGSICSGGRYDNLASLYTSQHIPGVGGSIGLDRILGAYEELGRTSEKSTPATTLVLVLGQDDLPYAVQITQKLREQGEKVELYPDTAKMGNQLKYASRKGMDFAVIAGEREREKNVCSLKALASGTQHDDVAIDSLAELISKIRQEQ
jgi:histidyl-tRNA synthetase